VGGGEVDVAHAQTERVRAVGQQDRLFVGMILILIFAEALGLYGLIVALILSQKGACAMRALRCRARRALRRTARATTRFLAAHASSPPAGGDPVC
jgi:hypothetical protein